MTYTPLLLGLASVFDFREIRLIIESLLEKVTSVPSCLSLCSKPFMALWYFNPRWNLYLSRGCFGCSNPILILISRFRHSLADTLAQGVIIGVISVLMDT